MFSYFDSTYIQFYHMLTYSYGWHPVRSFYLLNSISILHVSTKYFIVFFVLFSFLRVFEDRHLNAKKHCSIRQIVSEYINSIFSFCSVRAKNCVAFVETRHLFVRRIMIISERNKDSFVCKELFIYIFRTLHALFCVLE